MAIDEADIGISTEVSAETASWYELEGFDDQRYRVALHAGSSTVSLCAVIDDTPVTIAERDFTNQQKDILVFALEQEGRQFRWNDYARSANWDVNRFNFSRLLVEPGSGVKDFFTSSVGEDVLWRTYDGRDHQLGRPRRQVTSESRDDFEAVKDRIDLSFVTISKLRRKLVEEALPHIPEEGIMLDVLLRGLSGIHNDDVEQHLLAAMNVVNRAYSHRPFWVVEFEDSKKIRILPTPEVQAGVEHDLVLDHERPAMRKNKIAIPKKLLETPPDPDRELRWSIVDNGIVVDGEFIEIHPNIRQLIDLIGSKGDEFVRVGELMKQTLNKAPSQLRVKDKKAFRSWVFAAVDTLNYFVPVIIVDNSTSDRDPNVRDTATQLMMNRPNQGWGIQLDYDPGPVYIPTKGDYTLVA